MKILFYGDMGKHAARITGLNHEPIYVQCSNEFLHGPNCNAYYKSNMNDHPERIAFPNYATGNTLYLSNEFTNLYKSFENYTNLNYLYSKIEFKSSVISSIDFPDSCITNCNIDGSIAPLRVPIISPSSGVNPIVVS
mgnify:CR=1 FL=1